MTILDSKGLDKSPGKRQPIYQQIVRQIRQHIETEQLKPGEHLPPTAQLVKQWRVGYSTVNAALGVLEKDGLITRDTQWGKGPLVLNADQAESVCAIGFSRWCGTAQFVALERGIRHYADEHGLQMVTADAMNDPDRYIDSVLHPPRGVQGLILYPWDTPEYRQAVREAQAAGIKLVFVDRVIDGLNVSSVSVDHFTGSYEVTMHLIEQHGGPVHYFGNTDRPSSVRLRFQGYLEAMHEAGYGTGGDEPWVFKLPRQEGEVQQQLHKHGFMSFLKENAMEMLRRVDDTPFAVACTNDDAARAICMAADELGLQIGEDILVAGFGDKPYCENLPVSLTSVAQFDERTGYEAAKLLYEKMNHIQKRSVHLVLPAELRVRRSSTK